MKSMWLVWVFIVGVASTVLLSFNYRASKVPLTEIFPDEKTLPVDVEYEFINNKELSTEEQINRMIIKGENKRMYADITPDKEQTVKTVKTTSALTITPSKTATAPKTQLTTAPKISYNNYSIQVASLKTNEQAQVKLKEVRSKGYEGYIKSIEIKEKGTWYRVYVGKYATKAQAQTELNKIIKDYKDSFIIAL